MSDRPRPHWEQAPEPSEPLTAVLRSHAAPLGRSRSPPLPRSPVLSPSYQYTTCQRGA